MRSPARLIALLALPLSGADWVRVAVPRIEVLTKAGEKRGGRILPRLEEIHGIFHQANIGDSPLGVRVFVFASEKEFAAYRHDSIADGFYQSAPERDYIVMH